MKHRVWASVLTVMLVLTALVSASGRSRADTSCGDPGAKVPVLFVHGWNEGPGVWQAMQDALRPLNGHAYVADGFDYQNVDGHDYSRTWVSDDHIGAALADRIVCLANASKAKGGIGKVIVVAHSMGGLALRFAATRTAQAATVQADLGLVVTIGTPNTGSWISSGGAGFVGAVSPGVSLALSLLGYACSLPGSSAASTYLCALYQDRASAAVAMQIGSPELAESKLPELPPSIPLLAIAGRIDGIHLGAFDVYPLDGLGDGVVSVESATVNQNVTSDGGGKFVRTCPGGDLFAIVAQTFGQTWLGKSPCFHNGLLTDPRVEGEVTGAIGNWISLHGLNLAPFIRSWGAHSGGLIVKSDGTAELSYRLYQQGGPVPSDYAQVVFRFTAVVGTGGSATVEASGVVVSSVRSKDFSPGDIVRFVLRTADDTLDIYSAGGFVFYLCGDNAAPGACGA
jgi:pimeloyl-ACP methyl ester carboxylesterase